MDNFFIWFKAKEGNQDETPIPRQTYFGNVFNSSLVGFISTVTSTVTRMRTNKWKFLLWNIQCWNEDPLISFLYLHIQREI